MKDFLKKSLFAGLGILEISRKEAESILNKLVEKGKISAEGAETVAKEFIKHGKTSAAKVDSAVSELTQTLVSKMPFTKKDEFAELLKRVEKLEKELKKKRRTSTKKKNGHTSS